MWARVQSSFCGRKTPKVAGHGESVLCSVFCFLAPSVPTCASCLQPLRHHHLVSPTTLSGPSFSKSHPTGGLTDTPSGRHPSSGLTHAATATPLTLILC